MVSIWAKPVLLSLNIAIIVQTFNNTLEGFQVFCTQYETILPESLVVIETTGGYEMALIYHLLAKKVVVHRANARKIKYFIRSLGKESQIRRYRRRATKAAFLVAESPTLAIGLFGQVARSAFMRSNSCR